MWLLMCCLFIWCFVWVYLYCLIVCLIGELRFVSFRGVCICLLCSVWLIDLILIVKYFWLFGQAAVSVLDIQVSVCLRLVCWIRIDCLFRLDLCCCGCLCVQVVQIVQFAVYVFYWLLGTCFSCLFDLLFVFGVFSGYDLLLGCFGCRLTVLLGCLVSCLLVCVCLALLWFGLRIGLLVDCLNAVWSVVSWFVGFVCLYSLLG